MVSGLLLSLKVDGLLEISAFNMLVPMLVSAFIDYIVNHVHIFKRLKTYAQQGWPCWKLCLSAIVMSQAVILGACIRYLQGLLIVLKVDGVALKDANYFEVLSPTIIVLSVSCICLTIFQCVFCMMRGRSDGLFGGYGFFTEFFLQFILTRHEIMTISED
eukprot:gb/GECG01008639.1/.p1 GENE.gb/GECG01008639.1/~~gb/GECG01008639.1/.p1  ORF type:complete len:160 (+),score=9.37 gb/GECG01008639.1/:1-480(+)